MSDIAFSIFLCFAALIWLVWLLRRDRLSLGLPVAYMIALLLIHVPGAFIRLTSDAFDYNASIIAIGIRFAAIGALSFVAGVYLARYFNNKRPAYDYVDRRQFWYFCLLGGLFFQFGLSFLNSIPSIAAAFNRASAVWMLGALLGLRFALARGQTKYMIFWGAATMVYPSLILLLSGFLSYGSSALIIVTSPLTVSVRSRMKLIVTSVAAGFIGLTVFVNYFAHRDDFRAIAWSGASLNQRVDAAVGMFSSFQWFDPDDDLQASALDKRLNQNFFVGLAAERISQEQVSYLNGRSIWEGFVALIPRALWPDKPVFGGSGTIVADMTGLRLNEDTSWGVGNVMEFQINFGTPGVIIGFLILGFSLGWLDYKAALADARGDIGKLILFFLVAVALIQPGGSIVELAGGAAAAVAAAYGWKWVWQFWLWFSSRSPNRQFAALR